MTIGDQSFITAEEMLQLSAQWMLSQFRMPEDEFKTFGLSIKVIRDGSADRVRGVPPYHLEVYMQDKLIETFTHDHCGSLVARVERFIERTIVNELRRFRANMQAAATVDLNEVESYLDYLVDGLTEVEVLGGEDEDEFIRPNVKKLYELIGAADRMPEYCTNSNTDFDDEEEEDEDSYVCVVCSTLITQDEASFCDGCSDCWCKECSAELMETGDGVYCSNCMEDKESGPDDETERIGKYGPIEYPAVIDQEWCEQTLIALTDQRAYIESFVAISVSYNGAAVINGLPFYYITVTIDETDGLDPDNQAALERSFEGSNLRKIMDSAAKWINNQ